MPAPLLIGHRGARKYAPENTVSAFQRALDHGCDGFEFDVRLTVDSEAVLCHDPKYEGLVVERTTRDALTGRWPSEAGLAFLDEVLERFHRSAFLNIELKVSGAEEYALELLQRFPPEKGCVVSSFIPAVVLELARLNATVPLGLICESHPQLNEWTRLPVQAVMARRDLISKSLISELHDWGKQLFVWTVNSANEMRDFADAGVDGIISDDTRLLFETLRRPQE
jgi:glycerophosphoryl diester phosphodiesterase